ncbi:hypothetical protein M3M33_17545, partial [Loigolactobacillus coryniformis]|uniref:hypothetical protein n=1 Tax=Loigolactobacillus coryniformis TaxID=1610 RepID=UPI00201A26E6
VGLCGECAASGTRSHMTGTTDTDRENILRIDRIMRQEIKQVMKDLALGKDLEEDDYYLAS